MLPFVLAGCYRPPSENQLASNFMSHRAAFDQLATMALADKKFYRVSGGEIAPRGMSEQRYNGYLAIFRELGVEDGMNWGAASFPDGLFVIASSCVPIGGKSQSVGYAYLAAPPDAVEKRLPIFGCPIQTRRGSGQQILFRPLEGRWYLFYGLEW